MNKLYKFLAFLLKKYVFIKYFYFPILQLSQNHFLISTYANFLSFFFTKIETQNHPAKKTLKYISKSSTPPKKEQKSTKIK